MQLVLPEHFLPHEKTYKHQDRMLDKFYTHANVAQSCIETLYQMIGESVECYHYVEPSAGEGAFLDVLPYGATGIDIAPPDMRDDIIKMDFLQWMPTTSCPIIVVGNPPFGKNASLALKFINHAASFASYIAFILPRTFEKESMQYKIADCLELLYQKSLSPHSFYYQGLPYSVPVVFQIWKKTEKKRMVTAKQTNHPDFMFVHDSASADFAFQRVGARAGLVSYEGLKKSNQSHYFIKSLTTDRDVMHILAQIDWSVHKYKTAGNPSISKRELIAEYVRAIA